MSLEIAAAKAGMDAKTAAKFRAMEWLKEITPLVLNGLESQHSKDSYRRSLTSFVKWFDEKAVELMAVEGRVLADIIGKGGKLRTVPMADEVKDAVDLWTAAAEAATIAMNPRKRPIPETQRWDGHVLRAVNNKGQLTGGRTDGGLELTIVGAPEGESSSMLRFYRYDRVVDPLGHHADFLREANGRIKWFRQGRLYARQS